jgi:hypothetical protein
LPDTFQVVDVYRGGRFKSLIEGGSHSGRQRGWSFTEWERARFNKVNARTKKQKGEPEIYQTTLHEAIGHGYIAPSILPASWNTEDGYFPFITEGLATYVEYAGLGKNPHDYFRKTLAYLAFEKFTDIDGKWKELDSAQVSKKIQEKSSIYDMSIRDVFRIFSDEKILSKDRSHDLSDYVRGGSFIKFFIDRFGMDKFRSWARTTNRGNFSANTMEITGMKTEDIERDWRREVLDGFIDNPLLNEDEETFTDKHRDQRLENRRQALGVYFLYS